MTGWLVTFGLFFIAAAWRIAVTQGQTPWVPRTTWVIQALLTLAVLCLVGALCLWRGFRHFVWSQLPRVNPHPQGHSRTDIESNPSDSLNQSIVAQLQWGGSAGPDTSSRAVRRARPPLTIDCRGFFLRRCHIPLTGDDGFQWETLEAQTIAFRNDSRICADQVVGKLEFLSDTDQSVVVNEAWWGEKGERRLSFCIDRRQTKHLIVASTLENRCFAFTKIYSREWGRDLTDPVPLGKGRWRLKINLTADDFQEFYYSIGEVMQDGQSKWSAPSKTQPPEWNVEGPT
jgi:hypothetical protein